MLRRIAVVTLGLGLGVGCAEPLVRIKMNVPSLALSAVQPTINRDGIGVGAQLLGFTEFQQGRAPSIEVRWKEIDVAAARAMNRSQDDAPTKQMRARIPLVPVPSVFFAIDNKSDSPVTFKGAKAWLESSKGRKVPVMLNVSDVASRIDLYMREKYPKAAESEEVLEGLRDRVGKLPLFSDELVIKANSRFDGLLVLDLGSFSLKESVEALGSDQKFTLRLSGLGGASEPLEISVPFEGTQSAIVAECIQGKPINTTNCKLPPLQ